MTILIANGLIIDGSGRPGYLGDVLVRDGLIAGIRPYDGAACGESGDFRAQRILDATDLVVAPGFIDTHSHSDLKLLENPFIEAKIRQGITTEILGQDGVSLAPLPRQYLADWRKNLAGLEGTSESISWDFPTTDAYLSLMEAQGVAINESYLVPHGNVRMEAMGLENRPATAAEIERMKVIVRREMAAGAIGLSTGLIYIPCAYGDTEELIEMCKVVAEFDGVFVTHQRSEANNILPSMAEIIRIGRESGVKLHFSHFKICGRLNWDKFDQVVAILEQARADGLQVSFDQYPYTAGSTMLGAILPPWAHAGGTNQLLLRLADPVERQRIIADIRTSPAEWDNFVEFAGLEGIFITSVESERNQTCIGLNLVQLGQARGKEPLEAALDLLLEEENAVSMVDFYGKDEQIAAFIQRPEMNLCTDGLLGGKPHPRAYGAFPRLLGSYVREQGILSLEAAIHKMTLKAAQVFRLSDRGELAVGKAADIVVFDPATIGSSASYEDPIQYPSGIPWVLVNGRLLLDGGRLVRDSRNGRVIRQNQT